MTETADRVLKVMAGVLEMPPGKIPPDAAPGLVETWDSLKHMQLVVALEDEFDFRFTDREMADLSNLPRIVGIVASKLART